MARLFKAVTLGFLTGILGRNRSRGTKLLKTICCDSDFRKNGQNMRSHDPV
jgi:hypothetical protein